MELEKIFTDQQTGKNFNRPRYQVLKEDVLIAGDELIITEVEAFVCFGEQVVAFVQFASSFGKQFVLPKEEVEQNEHGDHEE